MQRSAAAAAFLRTGVRARARSHALRAGGPVGCVLILRRRDLACPWAADGRERNNRLTATPATASVDSCTGTRAGERVSRARTKRTRRRGRSGAPATHASPSPPARPASAAAARRPRRAPSTAACHRSLRSPATRVGRVLLGRRRRQAGARPGGSAAKLSTGPPAAGGPGGPGGPRSRLSKLGLWNRCRHMLSASNHCRFRRHQHRNPPPRGRLGSASAPQKLRISGRNAYQRVALVEIRRLHTLLSKKDHV